MVIIKMQLEDNQHFETLRLTDLPRDTARQILQRMKGQFYEATWAYFDEDDEEGLSILGGLDGRFCCEWITPEGGWLLLRPGFSDISDDDVPVANNSWAWFPVEVIVDLETAAEVLTLFAKEGAIPQSFKWLPP